MAVPGIICRALQVPYKEQHLLYYVCNLRCFGCIHLCVWVRCYVYVFSLPYKAIFHVFSFLKFLFSFRSTSDVHFISTEGGSLTFLQCVAVNGIALRIAFSRAGYLWVVSSNPQQPVQIIDVPGVVLSQVRRCRVRDCCLLPRGPCGYLWWC